MSWNEGANDNWNGGGGVIGFKTEEGFQADNSGGSTANAGTGFGDGDTNGFGGGDSFGDNGGDGDDRTCRVCDQPGHLARDCPDKKPMECFNCGQVGHSKAECTNERVDRPFTGDCRVCGQPGHRGADCPDKPAEKCHLCDQEGHKAIDCTAKRTDAFKAANDMTDEEAWKAMKLADSNKDLDDFRKAFHAYCKYMFQMCAENGASPIKAEDLESAFRKDKFKMHLIAKKKEIKDVYTLVSPSGEINQEYLLTFQWSDQPRRGTEKAGWPANAEENMKRLESAGFQVYNGIPKCNNCDEMGHTGKHCKKEKKESTYEAPKVKCILCQTEGHRARDCTNRPEELCRRCKKPGHMAVDCTEPRSAEGVECNICSEMGHFSRDCPTKPPQQARTCRNCGEEGHIGKDCTNPANPALMVCRNCDETGHMGRDCKKPIDWSRVRCKNCGELGHTVRRCTQPGGDAAPSGGDGGGGNGGFETTAPPAEAAAASHAWGNDSGADGGVSIETSGEW